MNHQSMNPVLVLAILAMFFFSCQQTPSLVDTFPEYSFYKMSELGSDVQISFEGPDSRYAQKLDQLKTEGDSLFMTNTVV